MEDFARVNLVYAKYFQEPYPARACFEVARLPKDVQVEIESMDKVGGMTHHSTNDSFTNYDS